MKAIILENLKKLALSLLDVATSFLALIIVIITIFVPKKLEFGKKIQKLIDFLKKLGKN